ncbi:MAG: hypothetical protein GEV28_13415 [Actinophytocola sp.]|uniref:hypothetical protein n=1 Tax=Actinophytocola sp. TaxID=1872138 RepID=UPI001320CD63|nr:hypothetical protein [Actinophytocola sp.]MPZ81336.1 hypothetical protein [Actinophytocola sp.]
MTEGASGTPSRGTRAAALVGLCLLAGLVTTVLLVGRDREPASLPGPPPPESSAPAFPPVESSPPQVAPTPEPTPEETDRQETVDQQRELLRRGHVAYRAPSPMRVDDLQRVTVRVADTLTPSEWTASLPGTGVVELNTAIVGSDLVAELSGPDFEISRVGGDDGRRVLATGEFVEWAWDVRPQRSGLLRLDLVLYVRLRDGGPPLDVRTFDQSVEVEVNAWYGIGRWLRDYWPLTGLTAPVLATGGWVLVRKVRARLRSNPESGAPDRVPARSGPEVRDLPEQGLTPTGGEAQVVQAHPGRAGRG